MSTREPSLPLPRPPEARPSPQFPLLATLAPVAASLALFAFTSSPFALIFAVLGPVIAGATMLDSRWQGARHRRSESVRFEREVLAIRELIAEEQRRERDRLGRLAPPATELIDRDARQPGRWKHGFQDAVPVTLGAGTVPFELISRREHGSSSESGLRGAIAGQKARDIANSLEAILVEATRMENAPIIVDARQGIAVVGPRRQALAVVNAIVVQLANALSPRSAQLHFSCHEALSWLHGLPHTSQEPQLQRVSPTVEFRSRSDGNAVCVVASDNESGIPRECGVVVSVGGGSLSEVVAHPDHAQPMSVRSEFVSAAQARRFAFLLAAAAAAGREAKEGSVPDRVEFADLDHARSARPGSLACPLGVGEHGVDVVDLVADGPHALVGGTTGSGKSELLVGWVLSLAASYPATEVNFLLVDFKGGASFHAISSLPHCVGVVTDLEHSGARRALESLGAELRRRERLLAEAGVSSISELGGVAATLAVGTDEDPTSRRPPDAAFARLVIVVDEFATLAATLPELQELFADIASRGRSLGLHLILCTQRPAGVVRDAVFANCALRVSLRVNNSADSIAVVGTAAASALEQKARGRAIIAAGDDGQRMVQLALAGQADIERVRAQWPVSEPFRPWRTPLASRIEFSELSRFEELSAPGTGLAFAVLDVPSEQRQAVLRYEPSTQGNLLVVGTGRSGKTGVLAALEQAPEHAQEPAQKRSGAAAVQWLPSEPEGAWDGVAERLEQIRRGIAQPGVILLDDIDVVIGRLGNDYGHAFIDSVVSLMREGPVAGVTTVVTTSRISAAVQAVADAADNTVLLRTGGVQDHLLAGGDRLSFDQHLPAGGGFWRGQRIHVVLAPITRPSTAQRSDLLSVEHQLAVVSGAPHAIVSRLSALGMVSWLGSENRDDPPSGAEPRIFLGDPDSWQSEWSLLSALRHTAPVAFHRCTPAQFRMITRSAQLPPPLAFPDDTLWVALPDGQVSRARLPKAG